MKTIDNGNKPAYPNVPDSLKSETGLTKREAFAMAAMQGILAKEGWTERILNESTENNFNALSVQTAHASVRIADELLKALEK